MTLAATNFADLAGAKPIDQGATSSTGQGYVTRNETPLAAWIATGWRTSKGRLFVPGCGWGVKAGTNLGSREAITIEGNGIGPLRAENAYMSGGSAGAPSRWLWTNEASNAAGMFTYSGPSLTLRQLMLQGRFSKTSLSGLTTASAATRLAAGLALPGGKCVGDHAAFSMMQVALNLTATGRFVGEGVEFSYCTHVAKLAGASTLILRNGSGVSEASIAIVDGDDEAWNYVTLEGLDLACDPADVFDPEFGGRVEAFIRDCKNADGETVSTHFFWDAGAVTVIEDVEVIHESVDVERDLHCISMDDQFGYDNYAKLAPAFRYDSNTAREIVFPGKPFGHSQTLHTTHRNSLSIRGLGGGVSVPLSQDYRSPFTTPPTEKGFGGPGASLVWLGAPGGTMVRINGPGGLWSRVGGQGQASLASLAALQGDIDFSLGAKTFLLIASNPLGMETNVEDEPYYQTPGKWTIEDFCAGAISNGCQAGSESISNHGDHCVFTGSFTTLWVEDGFITKGANSLQFLVDCYHPIATKRMFTSYAGGQVKVCSGRLQGGGSQSPTLLHLSGCERAGGSWEFDSFHIDGTLTSGFKFIDHGEIETAFDTHPDIVDNGASASMFSIGWNGGRIETAVGVVPKPWFRIPGATNLTLNRVVGLERDIFEFTNLVDSNWFGTGSKTARGQVSMNGCVWPSHASQTHNPSLSVHASTGSNKHKVVWRDNTMDYGLAIADDEIVVT